ncbi:hypothetical protein NLU13_3655 [Sarocladium strictum]|uniref:Uncharacterized protein n=1 Tax=Sarocladium strictum TaxID=5046 RepID=A0AA39GMG8_SARSR|nr:hypothetical protein NLU13_3655 [Sarocladium strictum]
MAFPPQHQSQPPAYSMYQDEYIPGRSHDDQYDYSNGNLAYRHAAAEQKRSYDLGASPVSASLDKLVVIPATSPALGSPFLRAYAPVLNGFGISQDTFLEFVDRLNRAAVASPPVQVLGLAGNIAGMVPLHTAQIVGGAVNAAATITTIAMSKGRVEMVLRKANEEVFAPRGLRARIAKLEAVAQLCNMPILDAQGTLNKNSSILLPMESVEDSASVGAQQRRIDALGPWISPLEIKSLPAVQTPSNAFSKMHTFVSERQRTKEEKKLQKGRRKMHEDWLEDSSKAQKDYEKDMRKLDEEERKARGDNKRKSDQKLEKIQREREKVEREYQKDMAKVEKDRKKDDKEETMMRKILFLVVQPANAN